MKHLLKEDYKNFFFVNGKIDFNSTSSENSCFRLFDHNNKGHLDEKDFYNLLEALISDKTKPTIAESNEFFFTFDKNGDGKIDAGEFKFVWNNWIKKLLNPVTALLVIDVQNDFIDGSLAMRNCPAKQEAAEIIPVINRLLDSLQFNVVAYSLDQHPENHISFFDNLNQYQIDDCKRISDIKLFDTVIFTGPPKMEQKMWPKHCVQGTWGVELHPDLKKVDDAVMIDKGTKSEIDSYSAFYDNMKFSMTHLHSELQQRHVSHVFVCGVAYDCCVAFTAFDSLELGYATTVVEDATRGTNAVDIEKRTKEMKDYCAVITDSHQLENLINGKDIRLEFAKVLKKDIS